MIDALRAGQTVNFHNLKRRLSNAAVDDLVGSSRFPCGKTSRQSAQTPARRRE
jgi:hypothetical protein